MYRCVELYSVLPGVHDLEQQYQCVYRRVELYSFLPGDHDLEQQHQCLYRCVKLYSVLPGVIDLEQQHERVYRCVELYSVLPGVHDLKQQHQCVYRRVELHNVQNLVQHVHLLLQLRRVNYNTTKTTTTNTVRVCLHRASASTLPQLCDDACDTVLIKNNRIELLQNGVATHFHVTSLFQLEQCC